MSLVMTGILKVPMQFLILTTGVFLLVFYHFEHHPVFFNPAEVERVQSSPVAGQFNQAQMGFDAAFEKRRQLGLQLIEARRSGDAAMIDGALSQYEAANREVAERRKEAAKIIQQVPGAQGNDVNYVYPSFLLKYVPVGLVGLMISVIFAAAMSSISAEIAALSSSSMIDYYRRFFKRDGSDAHYLTASRIATLFWGAFATVVASYMGGWGTSLVETVNKIGSHFYGPILGVFLLAFLVKRANGHGAFWGVLLGMAAVVYVSWATTISWLYYNVVGAVVVVAAGAIISLFIPQKPSPQNSTSAVS
jgi:solute:Na+ symporter, SSS family